MCSSNNDDQKTKLVLEGIDKNYNFIKKIEKILPQIDDIECKLKFISAIGTLYSELVTGVYSSVKLESELNSIGKAIQFNEKSDIEENSILIVMTMATYSGGHSVIAHNWIKWDNDRKYSIVFTDMIQNDVPKFINEIVNESGGRVYYLSGNYIEKVRLLRKIAMKFSRIILLQHMDDIIPNLTFSSDNWMTPVYLINHANFRFSFGYSIADAIINILPYDVKKTIDYRGIKKEKSVLLQFPNKGSFLGREEKIDISDDIEGVLKKYNINKKEKKLIVSMGQDYKYEDIEGVSFTGFVEKLMHGKDNAEFIIIGPNSNMDKWRQLHINTNCNAKAIGYIPRKDAYSIISQADLYIASFPMVASGLDIVDSCNIPYLIYDVVGRSNGYFRKGYVSSIDELIKYAEKILDGYEIDWKSDYYFDKMSQKEWVNRLNEIYSGFLAHSIEAFEDVRLVKLEEVVNYQLMQRSSLDNIKHILLSVNLPNNVIAEFVSNCRSFEPNMLPNILSMCVPVYKKIYEKNKQLNKFYRKWIRLKNSGKSIANYFADNDIISVVIYGAGDVGKELYYELNGSEYIECIVDKYLTGKIGNMNIMPIGMPIKNSRYMINTTFVSESQIRYDYMLDMSDVKIISIFDIIDELYEKN